MSGRLRRSEARWTPGLMWFFTPPAAVCFSLAVALVSVLMPRRLYEGIVQEPNRMHLNAGVILFVSLCTAAFGLGLWLGRLVHAGCPGSNHPGPGPNPRGDPRGVAVVVLLLGGPLVFANLYLIATLLRTITLASLVLAFTLEEGSKMVSYQALGVLHAGAYWIPLATAVVVQLGFWVYLNGRTALRPGLRRVLGLTVFACCMLLLVTMVLTVKRGPLLAFGLSLIMLWILDAYRRARLTRWRLALLLVPFVVAGIGYFSFTQVSKNVKVYQDVGHDVGRSVLGYYVGPYNRLAAVLDGDLNLGSGGGYYWSRWIWEFSGTNAMFGLDKTADRIFPRKPPSGAEERTWYIASSGFERRFTAISAFGMSFVDFGWLGFLPFLPYGMITGLLWLLFLRGRLTGVLLYPAFFWSVLEWRGYLEISREQLLAVLVFSGLIWILLQVRILPLGTATPAPGLPQPYPGT